MILPSNGGLILNVPSLPTFPLSFIDGFIISLRSRLQRTLHAANAPCGIAAILSQSATKSSTIFSTTSNFKSQKIYIDVNFYQNFSEDNCRDTAKKMKLNAKVFEQTHLCKFRRADLLTSFLHLSFLHFFRGSQFWDVEFPPTGIFGFVLTLQTSCSLDKNFPKRSSTNHKVVCKKEINIEIYIYIIYTKHMHFFLVSEAKVRCSDFVRTQRRTNFM